ncbi:uncharacterized protein zgc:113276 isoform X2 [Haplochromis burtoni]|uniref:uncharacterized protein zgc:113276 isoform X2 n=1 Tax=Haplochromis burtoni TaxID=8153 RepID=UPI0003BCBD11|nr:uncharacterized protein zgc:113276 isoform X2 [Haplochromis burtoni]
MRSPLHCRNIGNSGTRWTLNPVYWPVFHHLRSQNKLMNKSKQMVIHDVLIIGSGPHALTLASLLCSNDWDPKSDVRHDSLFSTSTTKSQPSTETSSNKPNTSKMKRKKRVTDGQAMEVQHAKLTTSERTVCSPLSLRVVDTYGEWTALWESQFTALNIPHLRSHSLVHTDPLNKKALQEFALRCERSAELHSLPEQVYILDENAFFNDMRLGKKERKRLNISSGLKKSLSFSLPGAKLSVDFFKEQLKQFDVGDVESLVGRYSHVEHGIKMDGQAYLRQFYNERSLHKRLAMIHQARKGGAVTPEAYIQLQPFIVNGQVDVKTYCQVSEASWCYRNQVWSLSLTTGEHWTGDKIWIATGCKLDVKQDPLLSEVMKEFPIQVIDGWPCITESLQWTEECPLYLMGQYAALQVGPHAVNLAGGQAASMRIAKDIIGRHQQKGGQAVELSGQKPKTEEYIQQMRGLFWL